jgi:hypothetical protein
MNQKNITTADPRLHIVMVEKVEQDLKHRFRQKEKELKQLLEELKAAHEVVNSTSREVEAFHKQSQFKNSNTVLSDDFSSSDSFSESDTSSLEDALNDIVLEKEEFSSQDNPVYASVSAQQLTVAINSQTIASLYDLVQKTEWSADESKQFLDMQYAVSKTMQYSSELSDSLQSLVSETYSVLQNVREQKSQQIQDAYEHSPFKHEVFKKSSYMPSSTGFKK